MNKTILLIILILWLFSCDNDKNTYLSIEDISIEDINIEDIDVNNDFLSFDVLYDKIIIYNWFWDKVSKESLKYLLLNDYFKSSININEAWYIINNQDFIYEYLKNDFNNYNIIKEYYNNELIINSDLNKVYFRKWRSILFFNENKNLYFNLAQLYNMNGVCSLIFNIKDEYRDFSWSVIKPNHSVDPINEFIKELLHSYEYEFWGVFLNDKELKKIDLLDKLDSNDVEILLYTLWKKYIESYDEEYLNNFYSVFENNLSIKYGHEAFTLFLWLKKLEWNDSSYCDIFNKEYFLWK